MNILSSTSGKVYDKNDDLGSNGLLVTLRNAELRGKTWKFVGGCFHTKTGDYAAYDERGQVYIFSLQNNEYFTARLASFPVTCMEFVHCDPTKLIVSYSHGFTVIINTHTREIELNIKFRDVDPFVTIKSHPTKPLATFMTQSGKLLMWDLRYNKCLRTLACADVIDFGYARNGTLLALCFRSSPVVFYRIADYEAVMICDLPSSERKPHAWTCFHTVAGPSILKDILLAAGDNGCLYVFDISHQHKMTMARGTLLCIVEMPPQVGYITSVHLLHRRNLSDTKDSLRVIVMADTGDQYILSGDKHSRGWDWWILAQNLTERAKHIAVVNIEAECCLTSVVTDDGNIQIHDIYAAEDAKSLEMISILRSRLPGEAPVAPRSSMQVNFAPSATSSPSKPKMDRQSSLESGISSLWDDNQKFFQTRERLTRQTSMSSIYSDTIESTTASEKQQQPQQRLHARARKNASLYTLVNDVPKDKRLSVKKLRVFYQQNGSFPDKYRCLIWRFLLKLPENEAAYTELVKQGIHRDFDSLQSVYPIKDRHVFTRLQNTCSQIAHWSPVFGQVEYLPQMVFPFVVLFGSDEIAALETVMTIIMWWGISWQATFPHAPMHITDSLDALLGFHDPQLRDHFYSLNLAPGLLAWSLLNTLFSEVLTQNDWLRLMDYVFVNFTDFSLMLLVPIAIMKTLRASLLVSTGKRHVGAYLSQPQSLHIEDLIKQLSKLQRDTPNSLLSAAYTGREDVIRKVSMSGDVSVEERSRSRARESIAAHEGKPIFPLPKDVYPAYDGFPEYLVDWQVKQRTIALSFQREIAVRENSLSELEEKIEQMEMEHQTWMKSHTNATALELEQRRDMMEREKKHLYDVSLLEERMSKLRLEALVKLESHTKEELSQLDAMRADAEKFMEESKKHLQEKIDAAYAIQKHREVGQAADAAVDHQMQKVYMTRLQEEQAKTLSRAITLAEEETESHARMQLEKWRLEDEDWKEQRKERIEQLQREIEAETAKAIQLELEEKLKQLEVARQAKILEMERERALRLIREQAEESAFALERARLERETTLMNTTLPTPSSTLNDITFEAKQAAQDAVEAEYRVKLESVKRAAAQKRESIENMVQNALVQESQKTHSVESIGEQYASIARENERQVHELLTSVTRERDAVTTAAERSRQSIEQRYEAPSPLPRNLATAAKQFLEEYGIYDSASTPSSKSDYSIMTDSISSGSKPSHPSKSSTPASPPTDEENLEQINVNVFPQTISGPTTLSTEQSSPLNTGFKLVGVETFPEHVSQHSGSSMKSPAQSVRSHASSRSSGSRGYDVAQAVAATRGIDIDISVLEELAGRSYSIAATTRRVHADINAEEEVKEFLQSMERHSSRTSSQSGGSVNTNDLLAGDSALWAVDTSKYFGGDDEM